MNKYFRNKKGQGTTEYIVILALIIGLLVKFSPNIKKAIEGKSEEIATTIKTGDAGAAR